MPNLIDMTGRRFGRLVVISRDKENTKDGKAKWLCRCDCGNEKVIIGASMIHGNTGSCGCFRKEESSRRSKHLHGAWNGGESIDKNTGYVNVRVYDSPTGGGRYMRKHRHVMEQHIGRPLLKSETVHHIDGNKLNNNIENLELWSNSHPPGQRVVDKVLWARNIVRQYPDVAVLYPN